MSAAILDSDHRLQRWNRASHLAGTLAAVLLLAVTWCLDLAAVDRIDRLGMHRDELEAEIRNVSSTEDRRHELASQLAEVQKTVAALQERLIDEPQESRLIAKLAAVAQETGVTIRSFRPGSVFRRKDLHELTIQISCDGTYEAFCDFLEQVRDVPRVLQLVNLKISAADPVGASLHIDMQLVLVFGKTS